jgi:prevent-host-death family protein
MYIMHKILCTYIKEHVMPKRVSVATARSNLSELLNRVAYGGETVIIEARGKPKAALVSADSITGGTGKAGGQLIVTTPNVRSGKPHIAGRRITVSDVVIWHEHMRLTPQQIAADYDLSLAGLYAALSYYHIHRDEIEAEIEESIRFAEALQRQAPSPLERKRQSEHG